jgi:hypothetical protein
MALLRRGGVSRMAVFAVTGAACRRMALLRGDDAPLVGVSA